MKIFRRCPTVTRTKIAALLLTAFCVRTKGIVVVSNGIVAADYSEKGCEALAENHQGNNSLNDDS